MNEVTKEKIRQTLKGRRTSFPTVKSCGKAHANCKICMPNVVWVGKKATVPIGDLTSNVHIKGRLLSMGWKNECAICGLGPEWNGQPLVLHLDHIDGNITNNRLDNFRLLCPNCHSQTETYGWKNARRKARLALVE